MTYQDKSRLPGLVSDPALVRVRGTVVADTRDNVRGGLVGHIVAVRCVNTAAKSSKHTQRFNLHRQGVLIVTIADIATRILLVRATVHKALGVVDVAITGRAAGRGGVGDVLEVDKDQARGA